MRITAGITSRLTSLFIIFFCSNAIAQDYGTGSNPNSHYVHSYDRRDGTHVEGYYATNPNNSKSDNYGAEGNYNPHNGHYGSGY